MAAPLRQGQNMEVFIFYLFKGTNLVLEKCHVVNLPESPPRVTGDVVYVTA